MQTIIKHIKQSSVVAGFAAFGLERLFEAEILTLPYVSFFAEKAAISIKNTLFFMQIEQILSILEHINYFLTYFIPVFAINLFILIKYFGRKREEVKRGGELISAKQLKRQLTKDILREHKKSGLDARLYLSSNKIPVATNMETKSFFFLGAAGSGKTQGILNIASQIQEFPAIFYERKGDDFIAPFYRADKDLLFSPMDERSVKWNIFADVESDGDINFFVNSIIPLESNSKDAHWDEQARIILKAVFLHIWKSPNPSNKTLIDFLLANADIATLRQSLVSSEAVRQYGLTGDILGALTDDNQGQSVLATFNRYRNAIKLRCMYLSHEEANFSVKAYIKAISNGDNARLFLYNAEHMQGEYNLYLNLLINLLFKEILSLPNDLQRRIWLVFDEIQSLGANGAGKQGRGTIASLISFLAEARSKGACTVLATQSLPILEELVGKNNMLSLLQLLATKIIFSYDEPYGQRLITDFIGKQEIVKERLGRSESINTFANDARNTHTTEEKTQDILLASELANLRVLNAYLKISGYNVSRVEFEIAKLERVSDGYMAGEVGYFTEKSCKNSELEISKII